MEAPDPVVSAMQQCGGLGAGRGFERERLVQRLSGLRWKDQPGEPDPHAGTNSRARPRRGRPGGVSGALGPFATLQTGV